ncbi:MAG: SocA family protein [Endomicrobium sp.]|jgi:uncharacterized phage-associated protein|nr:SocA family protein [Endomicrobium sp.]
MRIKKQFIKKNSFSQEEISKKSGIMPKKPHYDIIPKKDNKKEDNMRISIPQNNIKKFKEAFIYILNKVGAKVNVGQTVLYKILYFIDFNYYELYEEQLMGLKYIKNTYGPTPIDFAKLIKQMQKDGDCEEIRTKYFNCEQTKYLPKRTAILAEISAQEIKHIDETLKRYSDKSAKELSEISHKDIPWLIAKNGKVIDYESVFYRTEETSMRIYENK